MVQVERTGAHDDMNSQPVETLTQVEIEMERGEAIQHEDQSQLEETIDADLVEMEPREVVDHEETLAQVEMNCEGEMENEAHNVVRDDEVGDECTRDDDGGNVDEIMDDEVEEDDNDSNLDGNYFTDDNEYCNDDILFPSYIDEVDIEVQNEVDNEVENEEEVQPENVPQAATGRTEAENAIGKTEAGNVHETHDASRPSFNVLDDDHIPEGLISGSDDSEYRFGCEERYTFFDPESDMSNLTFKIGMRFGSGKEFKEVVKNYCINEGKTCRFRPSEPKRVRAICKTEGCKWVIFASVEAATKTNDLVLKTLNLQHTNCNHQWKNKHITSSWIARKYVEKIRVNPRIPPRSIRQNIDEQYKSEISRTAAYNARRIALKMIDGDDACQYKLVWDYREELLRTHPDSTVVIEHEDFREHGRQPRFQRMYICLGPSKKGFLKYCRPIIGVDGCHVKGTYRGQILSAIGTDGSNGWWPIAWAVVEKEATEQWRWFFQLLVNDLEIPNQGLYLTFISDRQKQRTRSTVRGAQETNQADAVEHINESVAAHVIESDAAGGTEAEANEIGTEDLIQSVDDLLNEIRRSRATTIPNDEQAHPDLPEESRSRRNPTNLEGQGKKRVTRQSRTTTSYDEFGEAWLGGGGQRNRYSWRRGKGRGKGRGK